MPIRLTCAVSVLALCAVPAIADNFNRIATFPVTANMAAGTDTSRESSAEIISASADGNTLIYTDSPLGVVGLIDITDAANPKPLGNVVMNGEPTTAHIIGDKAFVGIDTTDGKFTTPSGRIAVVDIKTAKEVASCDLGGQPDSVAIAPDGSFMAVAIENQRDEEVNDGALPQMPAGFVVRLPIKNGDLDCAGLKRIELTGFADVAPEDPEPEFVDINDRNETVVTLQENNHIIVIDADGTVVSHFPAGETALDGVDTKRDGRLRFTDKTAPIPNEPDGVKWMGNDHFAIANEGDWKGGSRGFSIYNKDGTLVYNSGASLERAIAEIGHFQEKRADKKGVEIESVEYAVFDGVPYLFVVSERSSVVAVYDVTDMAAPELRQILPSGVSPEGIVALPARNLLITANEADLGQDGGARAHVMIYEINAGEPVYPMLTSAGTDPLIGWGALGALAAGDKPHQLFAASDSVYSAMPSIYEIDTAARPAKITRQIVVTRDGHPAQKMDIEGITGDGKGGFWLANEGRADKLVPHALFHVSANGAITEEVAFPEEIMGGQTRFGAEGVARVGNTLWVAIQREWGDDPKGQVKLLAYDLDKGEWGGVRYPLEPKGKGWIGLSEIAVNGDHAYFIERDNQVGNDAKLKAIYRVALADMKPAPLGGELPVVEKEFVRDLIPEVTAMTNGFMPEKIEGLTFDTEGNAWIISDNDGVEDSSGETFFWNAGKL